MICQVSFLQVSSFQIFLLHHMNLCIYTMHIFAHLYIYNIYIYKYYTYTVYTQRQREGTSWNSSLVVKTGRFSKIIESQVMRILMETSSHTISSKDMFQTNMFKMWLKMCLEMSWNMIKPLWNLKTYKMQQNATISFFGVPMCLISLWFQFPVSQLTSSVDSAPLRVHGPSILDQRAHDCWPSLEEQRSEIEAGSGGRHSLQRGTTKKLQELIHLPRLPSAPCRIFVLEFWSMLRRC